jgi:hypothetical protein
MIEAWSVLVPPYARRGGTSTDQMEKRLSVASKRLLWEDMVCLWVMDGFHEKRGGA